MNNVEASTLIIIISKNVLFVLGIWFGIQPIAEHLWGVSIPFIPAFITLLLIEGMLFRNEPISYSSEVDK